ncbi:hypothetical protein [Dysgonomonas alginatilytica]|nr:hypothetical protein [Dysgonomonas alginatilytica]
MTQIALLKKAEIPTNKQIQEAIQNMGYDFKIFENLEKKIDQNGLNCNINGQQTYFETYLVNADEVDESWIKTDLTNEDSAILFVWGADFAAAVCIGLISVVLIDQSKALIYYMDDQMRYTKEMLIADTSQILEELKKQDNSSKTDKEIANSNSANFQIKQNFWNRLKGVFK